MRSCSPHSIILLPLPPGTPSNILDWRKSFYRIIKWLDYLVKFKLYYLIDYLFIYWVRSEGGWIVGEQVEVLWKYVSEISTFISEGTMRSVTSALVLEVQPQSDSENFQYQNQQMNWKTTLFSFPPFSNEQKWKLWNFHSEKGMTPSMKKKPILYFFNKLQPTNGTANSHWSFVFLFIFYFHYTAKRCIGEKNVKMKHWRFLQYLSLKVISEKIGPRSKIQNQL